MEIWWNSLGSLGQVFACIAIPATVVLVIQMILLIIGIGADHDADASGSADDVPDVQDGTDADIADGHADIDTHDGVFGEHDDAQSGHSLDSGLRLFTLRGIVAFFAIAGWVGVICSENNVFSGLGIAIAAASGLAAMILVAFIMKWMFSLQSDGSENIKNALGCSGTVYIRVPSNRNGSGKINLMLQGALAEKSAVCDEETDILYGEEVVVIGITGETTLVVKRKK